MTTVKLKIAELRKKKGIGQQELAEVMGVSFQSISKWETGITMPDITLLPGLAEYFNVTVDELLGLKPLPNQSYMPRNSDERDSWNGKTDKLCTNFDFHEIWRKELGQEGRDYAIGMRLPFYMQQLGLHDIDIRMNDRVMYGNSEADDYEEKMKDFLEINGLDQPINTEVCESTIELFMNRGLDRVKAEAYFKRQKDIMDFFMRDENRNSFLKVHGLLIAYGRK